MHANEEVMCLSFTLIKRIKFVIKETYLIHVKSGEAGEKVRTDDSGHNSPLIYHKKTMRIQNLHFE